MIKMQKYPHFQREKCPALSLDAECTPNTERVKTVRNKEVLFFLIFLPFLFLLFCLSSTFFSFSLEPPHSPAPLSNRHSLALSFVFFFIFAVQLSSFICHSYSLSSFSHLSEGFSSFLSLLLCF